MVGIYSFGGQLVQIASCHALIHQVCRGYACTGEPDIRISVQPQDICREVQRGGLAAPPEHLEITAVLRKLADAMVERDILLFHGSALALDGEGYLFTAKSGTGKSTHARLWRQCFPDRVVMVNDDKPFLKITEQGVFACGSPWDGKHHLSNNIMVPLKAVCILGRGTENEIHPVEPAEVLSALLEQCYRPEEPRKMLQVLGLLDKLSRRVKFYRLSCNMDLSAARIALEGMSETE